MYKKQNKKQNKGNPWWLVLPSWWCQCMGHRAELLPHYTWRWNTGEHSYSKHNHNQLRLLSFMLKLASNGNSPQLFSKCMLLILLWMINYFFNIVIFNSKIFWLNDRLLWHMPDMFSNHSVCINPAQFLQSTESLKLSWDESCDSLFFPIMTYILEWKSFWNKKKCRAGLNFAHGELIR